MFLSIKNSEQVFLVGSPLISPESSYKVLLSTHGIERNSKISVSFGSPGREEYRNFTKVDEDFVKTLEFQVVQYYCDCLNFKFFTVSTTNRFHSIPPMN